MEGGREGEGGIFEVLFGVKVNLPGHFFQRYLDTQSRHSWQGRCAWGSSKPVVLMPLAVIPLVLILPTVAGAKP